MHQWCIILIYLHPFNISPLMPPFDHACCTSPPSLYRGECTLEFSRKLLPITTKIGLLFGPLCSNWILLTWTPFLLWHPSLPLFTPRIYPVCQVTPPFIYAQQTPFQAQDHSVWLVTHGDMVEAYQVGEDNLWCVSPYLLFQFLWFKSHEKAIIQLYLSSPDWSKWPASCWDMTSLCHTLTSGGWASSCPSISTCNCDDQHETRTDEGWHGNNCESTNHVYWHIEWSLNSCHLASCILVYAFNSFLLTHHLSVGLTVLYIFYFNASEYVPIFWASSPCHNVSIDRMSPKTTFSSPIHFTTICTRP